MNKIYKIENEIEYLRIISALQEMKIEYTENKYSDSSFPVLNESEYYAEITVPEEYAESVNAIISNKIVDNDSKYSVNEKPKKIKFNYLILSLIIYSIISTFLCLYFWYSDNRVFLDKNFDIQFNTERTILSMVNKKSEKTAFIYFDENYDLNWEEYRTFSKSGEPIGIYNDLNEDGYTDGTSLYNRNQQKMLSLYDTNYDGIYDKLEVLINDKDTIKYIFNKISSFFELADTNKYKN